MHKTTRMHTRSNTLCITTSSTYYAYYAYYTHLLYSTIIVYDSSSGCISGY